MLQKIKINKEDKDSRDYSRISIVEIDGEKNGIYIPYGNCLMLEKLLNDLYLEKFSTEKQEIKKRFDFLFWLGKNIFKKYIVSPVEEIKKEITEEVINE